MSQTSSHLPEFVCTPGADDELMNRLVETRELLWGFLGQRLSGYADREDVIQETWIRAQRAWPRYKEKGQFRSWILRIAYRESCRYLRKHPQSVEILEGDMVSPDTPASDMQRNEKVAQIHQAIRDLPVKEREAVWLRVVKELEFKEMSYVLRCPEGTVVTRTRRGLQRLRQTFKEDAL